MIHDLFFLVPRGPCFWLQGVGIATNRAPTVSCGSELNQLTYLQSLGAQEKEAIHEMALHTNQVTSRYRRPPRTGKAPFSLRFRDLEVGYEVPKIEALICLLPSAAHYDVS